MKNVTKSIVILVLCVLTTLAAVPAFAQPEADALADAKGRAAGYLQQGDYKKAWSVLEGIEADDYDPQLAFLRGQCKFGMMDYSAAAFQYQLMLERTTNLPRVRTELARTLAAMGKSKVAKEEYEKVMAGDIPAAVRQNIMAQLQRIDEHRRWGGVFSLGYMYDSNVNGAPSDPNIKAFSLPFVLDRESIEKSDSAIVGSVSAGKYFDWFFGDEWRFDAYGNMTKYFSEEEFDYYSVGVSVGPNFYSNSQLSLPIGMSFSWEDDDPASLSVSFSPSLSKALSYRMRGSVQASISYNDDLRSSDESNGWSAGLSGNLQYSLNSSNMVELGLALFVNNANELDYNRYLSKSVSLGWYSSLPGDIRFSLQPSYSKIDYNDDDPVDAGKTRDDERYSVNANIYREVSVGPVSFTPVLAFTWTKNSSNIDRRDYRRRQVLFQIRKQF